MSRPQSLRYLALGDSYTIGEGVEEHERWPAHLATLLRKEGIPLKDPEIVAVTGWTTGELDAGIDSANPQGVFELVSLLIGVNDQYRGHDLDDYRLRFDALLNRARGFAGGLAERVLVLSIPDWSVTPFAKDFDSAVVARELDAFNRTNLDETRRAGARYVDITPLSKMQGSMVVADGLHPNAQAYRAWAELLLPIATTMLGPAVRSV